jgi:peptidoglycan/LPS O-acetylase OafA/YrhL
MNVSYRSDIDALRAIAILSVFIYHAFPEALSGGFIGVDVFFVISGYLISLGVFNEVDGGKFSFADFYARRTRRIFPALITVLLAVYCAGLFILLPVELTRLGKNLASAATFTLNFVLQRDIGYFDGAGSHNALLNLWSLCIEEQFYLLFPPIFLIAYKLRVSRLAVIVAIIVGSFLFNISLVSSEATFTFFSPVTRFWELAIGCWLAHFLPNKAIFQDQKVSLVLDVVGVPSFFLGFSGLTRTCSFQDGSR